MDHYSKLKPTPNEPRYVEYDSEFECWAVFGYTSGFCYAQYGSEKDAWDALCEWATSGGLK